MQNFFEEDLDDAIKNLDKASNTGGMWLQLKNDGDYYHCVLMEDPQAYKNVFEKPDGTKDISTRSKANFAVFEQDEKTGEYEYHRLAIWDNVDPKKMKLILIDIKHNGKKKLYKLLRIGKARDPKTQYRIYPQRDLTAEEIKMLGGLELLNLNKPEDTEALDDAAKDDIAKQIDRLRWSMDQYWVANTKFFGERRESKDMMVADRVIFIPALLKMAPGAEPTTIDAPTLSGEALDLDEDADFFNE